MARACCSCRADTLRRQLSFGSYRRERGVSLQLGLGGDVLDAVRAGHAGELGTQNRSDNNNNNNNKLQLG